MEETIKNLKISTIKIGKQFRQDLGDLKELAESIRRGLLQPIGVTPSRKLVFGYRRLLAYRDVLKLKTIPARIVDVPSILEGMLTENTMRKDFTVSERVAVFRTLKAEIGDRRGQRTDLQLMRKCAEVGPGETTDDFAAKRAGLGNRRTAERAESVVEAGIPELVEAVDRGEVSISAAAEVATLKPKDQMAFLKGHDEARLTAQQVRKFQPMNGQNRSPTFVFNGGNARSPRPNTITTPPGICRFLYDLISPKYEVRTTLDPSAGTGALTRPWKGRKVIAFEILKGRDFFKCPSQINCDLVVCNPPFNSDNGESRFLPELFLRRIVEVIPRGTPIVLFSPMALRLDQTTRSARWRWLRDHCPPITSIISLPHDAFGSVKIHSEILIFAAPKLEPHYFLPDKYLR